MRKNIKHIQIKLIVVILFFNPFIFASDEPVPKIGKAAAARYFQNEKDAERRGLASESNQIESRKVTDHFMAVGIGTFSESASYKWGANGRQDKVGKWGMDLTYRLDQQEYLFDEALRVSYAQYGLDGEDANKLSFLYAINLPEAASKFPIYFGGAAGLGLYMKQLNQESILSFDYQLYVGLRAFNLFDSVGVYIEGGLRNHLHLTSDGQFNGTFLSLGSIFNF